MFEYGETPDMTDNFTTNNDNPTPKINYRAMGWHFEGDMEEEKRDDYDDNIMVKKEPVMVDAALNTGSKLSRAFFSGGNGKGMG
eukprot:12472009-Ditylum_brightwellii.AAC.1